MKKKELVVDDLRKAYSNLVDERNEYEKYGIHLKQQISDLIIANEKLLSCLKDRRLTYSNFSENDLHYDELMDNKINEIKQKKFILNKLLYLANSENKVEAISPAVRKSKLRFKIVRKKLEKLKKSPIGQIILLSEKKKKIEKENKILSNEIKKIKLEFDDKTNQNELSKEIKNGFDTYCKKSEENKEKRRERSELKLKIANITLPINDPNSHFDDESQIKQDSEKSINNLHSSTHEENPSKPIANPLIKQDSEKSINNLHSSTHEENSSKPVNNHLIKKDSQKSINNLHSSTHEENSSKPVNNHLIKQDSQKSINNLQSASNNSDVQFNPIITKQKDKYISSQIPITKPIISHNPKKFVSDVGVSDIDMKNLSSQSAKKSTGKKNEVNPIKYILAKIEEQNDNSENGQLIDINDDSSIGDLNDDQLTTAALSDDEDENVENANLSQKPITASLLFQLLEIDLDSNVGIRNLIELYDSEFESKRRKKREESEDKMKKLFEKASKKAEEIKKKQEELNKRESEGENESESRKKAEFEPFVTHSVAEQFHQTDSSIVSDYNYYDSDYYYEEEEEEEEEYFEEEEEFVFLFQKKVQTLSSMRSMKADALTEELHRIQRQQELTNKIASCEFELNDIDSDLLELTKKSDLKQMKIDSVCKRLQMATRIPRISVPPREKNIHVDKGIESVLTDDVDTIRKQIAINTSKTTKRFLLLQTKRDLEENLMKLGIESNIVSVENEKKTAEFDQLMSKLKIIDPYQYNVEAKLEQPESIHPELHKKKVKRLELLKKIQKRLDLINKRNSDLEHQICDQRSIIKEYKGDLYNKGKEPHPKIRPLCTKLKSDRNSFQEISRQTSLINVESEFYQGQIDFINQSFGKNGLKGFAEQIDQMQEELDAMKAKYNSLRGFTGKRSVVLTNRSEMALFQQKINDRTTEIDVFKMRMSGIVAKLDKQIRAVNNLHIRLPKPPEAYNFALSLAKKRASTTKPNNKNVF